VSLPELAWIASYVCPWGALLLAFVVFMRVVDKAAERVTDQLRPAALPRASEAATQVVPGPAPRSLHVERRPPPPPPTWDDESDTGRRSVAAPWGRGGGALVPDYTLDNERTEADER
jgi:hypothetical protein